MPKLGLPTPQVSMLPVVAGLCASLAHQVAVDDLVVVGVRPGPRDGGRQPADRVVGDEEARVLRRFEVAAEAELQRRLPVAEHIHRHAAARGQIVVRRAIGVPDTSFPGGRSAPG